MAGWEQSSDWRSASPGESLDVRPARRRGRDYGTHPRWCRGSGTTIAALPYYHAARAKATDENYNEDLVAALCTHGAIWLTVGVAAGLALGIGLGNGQRIARAVLGGILGACAGAVIYEFGGAILFPLAETFRPTAKEITPRLFAHLVVALSIAAGAIFIATQITLRRSKPHPDR